MAEPGHAAAARTGGTGGTGRTSSSATPEKPRPAEDVRWLKAIVASGGDAITALDPNGSIVIWNEGAERLYGYRAEEVIGCNISVLDTPATSTTTEEVRQRALAGEQVRMYETQRMRKDGSTVTISLIVSPVYDESGRVIGTCAIARDLSSEQEALLREESRFRALVHRSPDPTLVLDSQMRLEYASSAAEKVFGYKPDEVIGLSLVELVHPEDADRVNGKLASLAGSGGEPGAAPVEYRVRHADGTWRTVESVGINLLDDPAIHGIVVNLSDVTELRRAEKQLAHHEAWLDAILTNAFDLMLAVDARGCATFTTPATRRLLGTDRPGPINLDMFSYAHPEDVEAVRRAFSRLVDGTDTRIALQVRIMSADGTYRWLEVTGTNMLDDPIVNAVVLHGHDVTERHLAQEMIAYQAGHDALTGLPNRYLVKDRIVQALARTRREGGSMAVLFVDLDDFKRLNDSQGHTLGDNVLKEVAERLQAASRESDTVARFGGDEFVLVLENIESADQAREIGERTLATVFDRPVVAGERAVHLSGSVGVAIGTGKASPERLLADADTAMYAAKKLGRSRVEIFDQSMRSKLSIHVESEERLRRALADGEIVAFFQPIVSLEDGRMVGAEALARWLHPTQGVIPAAGFITVAEETGLIEPISTLVFEKACDELRRVLELVPGLDFTMSVNVSPLQLRDTRTMSLLEIAKRAGVDPRRLVVELGEGALLEEDESLLERTHELRLAGVRVAADDFGTGYSSLSYLKRLPIDVLKIDRMFVDGVGDDPLDTAVVDAVISMASALSLQTVAEGVETPEQRDQLVRRGVVLAQGFLFAEPLSPDEFEEELLRRIGAP